MTKKGAKNVKIIGITGGIGSGKSTASEILTKFGAVIIDADKIAREVVKKGSAALKEIADYFGYGVLNDEQELDRKKLSDIVFNNKEKLDVLNKITHKYIGREIFDLVKQNEDKNLLVIDAAIPLEHGFLDTVHEIWVIWADVEVRIQRVMKRSNISYDHVLKIIKSQYSDDYYFKIADYIIYNNDSFESLRAKIQDIMNSEK